MVTDLLEQSQQRLDAHIEPRLPAVIASVSRNHENPTALYELATLCRRHGHTDLWRAAVDCAFALPHDSYQQLYYRGRAKLLRDDWSGWQDLESRIHDPGAGYLASRPVRVLRFNTRQWDGHEAVEDKSLYLIADGGFSDCLQMLRYIPMLADRVGRLVVCVRPELINLVRQAYGDRARLTLSGIEDAGTCDRYAWMMSLPALTGDLPTFTPLPGVKRSPRLSSPERRDIGICWSGDPNWAGDRDRSLSADLLTPLLAREDIRWFNLQTGPAATATLGDERITPPASPLYSFAQTATLIAGLDAIITVDTAVAHLAGALGVATWLLLAADADPRWGIGLTTRWYPTIRLVRQRAVGDWMNVVAQVDAEIETCTV